MAKLLDGSGIARQIRKEIANKVELLKTNHGVAPSLAVILASDDPASYLYVEKKERACQEVGIMSTVFSWDKRDKIQPESFVREYINMFTSGVLVQLPIKDIADPKPLFDLIDPWKDVDVFHPENVGLLVQGRPRFKTCTPHGILVMLERSGIDVCGKTACIINNSDIVGKPLASLMMQAGATVTLCHHRTPPAVLQQITKNSEIVVVAVGQPNFLTANMITPGAIVVDVGITRLENRVVVGDVHPDVADVAGWLSPVPNGVGPLTICMLLENTLQAAKYAVEREVD